MGSSKETENSQMPNNDSVDSLQNGNDLVEKIEGSTLVTLEIAKETPQIDEFNEPLKEESDGLEVRKSPPLDTLPQIQIQSPNYMGPQVYSGSLDKLQPRRNPENFTQSNVNVPITITPEKPSEDGYNWRKYGQKFVKGNEFIRSYYKCTYPNCVAKKQVERSNTGPITDINYLGNHEHPQPQHILVQPLQTIPNPNPTQGELFQTEITTTTTTMPLTITASESYREENNNSTTNPEAKRQKRESNNIYSEDEQSKNCNEVRHVVKTMSEVDLVNDGYRWRKYGQKLVKGNPNPRSYYRCSNAGCPVKKHVERASHDIKLVITTYEGQHDHDMPVSRTLTSNTSSSAMTTGSSETGENTPNNNTTLDMVLHISAN